MWGPSPKPRKKGQVVGINNLGYTCFLNSLLQALAACPLFIFWLQKQQEKKDKNFADTLLSVLKKINGFADNLYGNVTPIEIISSVGSLWNFGPGHQDAHELFHVVLSALDAEMQPANRKGCLSDALPPSPIIKPDIRATGDTLNLRSASCNDIASVKNNSDNPKGFDKNCNNQMMTSTSSISSMSPSSCRPGLILARSSELLSRCIQSNGDCLYRSWKSLCAMSLINIPSVSVETHPFSGLITSQVQCSDCFWKSSVRYDKLETLSLSLPPLTSSFLPQHHTLEWLLLRFVDSEIVRDVQCDGCSSRCTAIKTLTLGKLPKYLCLHIPRTTWSSSGVPIKRDDQITFPEFLVLDPYTYTETKKRSAQGDAKVFLSNSFVTIQGKHKYRLCAVIEHRGPGGGSQSGASMKPGDDLDTDSTLKRILEQDYDLISNKNKLVLPAQPTVINIPESLAQHFTTTQFTNIPEKPQRNKVNNTIEKTVDEVNICREVADGLRIYFDFAYYLISCYIGIFSSNMPKKSAVPPELAIETIKKYMQYFKSDPLPAWSHEDTRRAPGFPYRWRR